MKISLITPFYQGSKYMAAYVNCLLKNYKNLQEAGYDLEVILVNDSPWEALEAPKTQAAQFIKAITNSENKGIHYSRVAGLKEATGDYVMFLDQDDLLQEDALLRLIQAAGANGSDVTVSNAYLEQADGSFLTWYRTDYHKDRIGDLDTYLDIGIQIISPGQCLIKREAIPDFWCQHLVRVNGADDYYLWLLMLAKDCKFSYLDQPLYIHKYTGDNISADTTATDASVYDFLELLHDCQYFSQKDIFRLHEMITYKNAFRQASGFGKISCSLAHLPLLLKNISYKRGTKTPLGFNR